MSDTLESSIMKVVEQVAKCNNVVQFKYNLDKFKTKGQNYFGILIPIVLNGNINGIDNNLDLVLKLAPTDVTYKISGALTLFFKREIFVYSTILNKYQEIQRDFPTRLVVPKCYYYTGNTDCQDALVLENMCTKGYKTYLYDFLDLNHMTESLKSLARFHAMSFILKENYCNLYSMASEHCVPLNEKSNARFMDILEDRLNKAIATFGNKQPAVLKNMKDNYIKYINDMSFKVKATAICHGDIWKENILYKYENEIPISACLIDFQTVRMSSPAYDVLYIITTSSKHELRKNNYKKLLEIYYQTFEQFLKYAELEASVIYSWNDFNDDLKTVAPACFIIANTALWLYNGLQNEGHVRSKKVLNTDEEKIAAINNFTKTIINIIDDYYNFGYL